MDLRDLRYFETVAELLHVGRAAVRLQRTQPAITGAIRRLEQEAQAPLVERSGRGIRLTTAGEVLLRWAQRMRFDIEDAEREVADIGRGIAGQVRIGIVPTAAQFLLPRAVRALMDEAPEVSLKTTVALVDVLLPMLKAGELDLVVGTQGRPDADLVTQPLTEDHIVVVAPSGHAVFEGRASLRGLVGHGWILQAAGAPTRDWLDHAFDRHGLPRPTVQVESSMLLVLPALIEQTGLLSFISRQHLKGPDGPGSHAALREVRLRETTMRRSLVLLRRRHAYQSPAAIRLAAHLTQAAGRPQKPR